MFRLLLRAAIATTSYLYKEYKTSLQMKHIEDILYIIGGGPMNPLKFRILYFYVRLGPLKIVRNIDWYKDLTKEYSNYGYIIENDSEIEYAMRKNVIFWTATLLEKLVTRKFYPFLVDHLLKNGFIDEQTHTTLIDEKIKLNQAGISEEEINRAILWAGYRFFFQGKVLQTVYGILAREPNNPSTPQIARFYNPEKGTLLNNELKESPSVIALDTAALSKYDRTYYVWLKGVVDDIAVCKNRNKTYMYTILNDTIIKPTMIVAGKNKGKLKKVMNKEELDMFLNFRDYFVKTVTEWINARLGLEEENTTGNE